ncbi:MAG TPA: rubrerythrin family protein, partial [Coriobacteriia bacterium]|nr:rubrerythrin family protein [Coriobacteriia bacterium]
MALARFQKEEATGHIVYARMARFEKHEKHVKILSQIATDELDHYNLWKQYTGRDFAPNRLQTTWYTLLFFLCGYTFVLRLMGRSETSAVKSYSALPTALPELKQVIADEEAHEEMLISILDEERLKYVGAIVLGLNDALVELSGALAGFTLALNDNTMIGLAGFITGVAATLSMAASEYLSKKTDQSEKHPLKAAFYTGMAYMFTVALLLLPYALTSKPILALGFCLLNAALIIAGFTFFVSVVRRESFL